MLIYALDDEQAVLHYTVKALKACLPEEDIRVFTDTDDFLEAFRETPADVVFMDIEMPGTDGITLAQKLNTIKENLNIVFVTGYDQYALEAFDVYASDYMKKPCTPEKIQRAMGKLRYPLEAPKDVFFKTFGNFDMFYKGTPVAFRGGREKEMLAYLVDREGALVSRQEMAGILFEDDYSRAKQVQLSKIAERLAAQLTALGLPDLFRAENGYRIDMSQCDCDMLLWKKGDPDYQFTGEYMEQYSFGEYRKGAFER